LSPCLFKGNRDLPAATGPFPYFSPPFQTNQNWHYLCTQFENNQGLTGFDSKDSGIVSMPGL